MLNEAGDPGTQDAGQAETLKAAFTSTLGGAAETPKGRAAIQKDLDRLERWAKRNLTELNKGKCQVLLLGRNNPRHHQYMLGAAQLESSSVEKAPGLLVDTKLNLIQPRRLTVARAALGALCSREGILPLSSALLRPHRECCVQCGAAAPSTGETRPHWREANKGPQRC